MTNRRIAFLVFPRVTFLDFVGACEVVTDRRVVDEALKRGVRDAMLRHKRDGLPVVVERDGKIEWVKPEDLGY